MITTKEIKIKTEFSSSLIEQKLKDLNLDVLSWAIIDYDGEFYTFNISIVQD